MITETEINKIKKILITRTDKLGDVILTLPLISETKRIFNYANVYFLVNSFVNDLLKNYEDIDELNFYDIIQKENKFYQFLKDNKFDLLINVFPRKEIAFDAFRARVKYRIGSGYRWFSFLYNIRVKEHRKDCKFHEAQYNLNLLKSITDKVEDNFKFKFQIPDEEKLKLKNKFNINSKFIIVHAGSKGSARDIPVNKLTNFIRRFLEFYNDYKVILTGINQESGIIAIIINNLPEQARKNIINTCGKLSLRELMVLIDLSELFISNSTGPIHIAGALNKKIIGFYPNEAPVNARRWGPLSKNKIILNPPIAGGSMDMITTSEVLKSADKLIKDF